MKNLVGQDLNGWRVEIWWELRLTTDEYGIHYQIDGYFSNKDVATAEGVGKSWYGGDGTAHEVFVITKDGNNGYVVSSVATKSEKTMVSKEDEERRKQDVITKAKSKLTPEERRLLNLN